MVKEQELTSPSPCVTIELMDLTATDIRETVARFVERWTNLEDDPLDKSVTVAPPSLFPELFREQATILGYTPKQIDYMIKHDTTNLEGYERGIRSLHS